MLSRTVLMLVLSPPLLVGCGGTDEDVEPSSNPTTERPQATANAYGTGSAAMAPEALERARRDRSWRAFVGLDTAAVAGADTVDQWDLISVETVVPEAIRVPLSGHVAGPGVAAVQILLDRALFSPGIIDGRWGGNTEKAVYWLQRREGLEATGTVDAATASRLRELGGGGALIRQHTLTAEEVAGPFVEIPEDVYAQADLSCMCYRSRSEKLADLFHTTPALLAQLNPDADLDALAAGASIAVPAVREMGAWWREFEAGTQAVDSAAARRDARIARLVISDGGRYLHALNASGRILYHFPTTLGSNYAPSPDGVFEVAAIAWDPTWHYQPDLLTGEPDSRDDVIVPAGPNNPVGVVWMELSKPHYGIHGTAAPETIGYTTSHGCIRLTNWDAVYLGRRIEPGVRVEFRDVSGRATT